MSGLLVLPLLVAFPFLREYLDYPGEPRLYASALMFMSAMIQFSIAYCFGHADVLVPGDPGAS